MLEEKDHKRRWAGFVCPACRLVFRVPRDHDGSGVVCPSCRRVLRIPAEGEEIEFVQSPEEDADEPQPETEIESANPEPAVSPSIQSGKWAMLGVAFCLMLLVAAGALAWVIKGRSGHSQSAETLLSGSEMEAQKMFTGGAAPPVPELDPALITSAKQVVAQFFHAREVEELLPLVHHPELTGERMKRYYGGEHSLPEGISATRFEVQLAPKSTLLACAILDSQHEGRVIYLHQTPAGPKLDWESWVGWSEMSWTEFQEKKPSEPKLFRVVLSGADYYNFGFSDDRVWQSFKLESMDGENMLYGYAAKDSELALKIRPDQGSSVLRTVYLKYPEGASSSSQVIIEKVVGDGWTE